MGFKGIMTCLRGTQGKLSINMSEVICKLSRKGNGRYFGLLQALDLGENKQIYYTWVYDFIQAPQRKNIIIT